MNRPNIEAITKKTKRGAKYSWMQAVCLALCEWITYLEENEIPFEAYERIQREQKGYDNG